MRLWDDFTAIVDREFRYLETDFGFRKVSSEIPFVAYESPSFRVSIFWESEGRYELDVRIKPLERYQGEQYSIEIGTLARIYDPRSCRNYEWLLVDDKEKLERTVKEVAELVKLYATDLLNGDLRVLDQIHGLRAEAARKYSKKDHYTI